MFWAARWIRNPPAEILSLIFQFAVPVTATVSDNGTSSYVSLRDAPLNISRVSRYWRAIALSTPSIWTRLCFDYPKLGLSSVWWTSLARSGEHPLDVYVQIWAGHLWNTNPLWNEVRSLMMDLFLNRRYRVRDLSLVTSLSVLPGWSSSANFTNLTLDDLPSLRTLDIRPFVGPMRVYQSALLTVDISKSNALESIRMDGDYVAFRLQDFMRFPYLTSIEIVSESNPINVLEEFVDLLMAAPALEVFKSWIPRTSIGKKSGIYSRNTLRLQRLRVLALHKDNSTISDISAAKELIDCLCLPALNSLCMTCRLVLGTRYEDNFHATIELEDAVTDLLQRSRPPLTYFNLRPHFNSGRIWGTIFQLPKPCLCDYQWEGDRSGLRVEYKLVGQCVNLRGCASVNRVEGM